MQYCLGNNNKGEKKTCSVGVNLKRKKKMHGWISAQLIPTGVFVLAKRQSCIERAIPWLTHLGCVLHCPPRCLSWEAEQLGLELLAHMRCRHGSRPQICLSNPVSCLKPSGPLSQAWISLHGLGSGPAGAGLASEQ